LGPANIPAAAVVILAETEESDRREPADSLRMAEALSFLKSAQGSDGGWGPYADAPSEVYDTALALLALNKSKRKPGIPDAIIRGRTFLCRTQNADGSWPATTRPSGGNSYAQQMSTTGWATLALLATREPAP
jgi:hypothetical protein